MFDLSLMDLLSLFSFSYTFLWKEESSQSSKIFFVLFLMPQMHGFGCFKFSVWFKFYGFAQFVFFFLHLSAKGGKSKKFKKIFYFFYCHRCTVLVVLRFSVWFKFNGFAQFVFFFLHFSVKSLNIFCAFFIATDAQFLLL